MPPKNIGYLLPETMEPATARCVLIAVPDDQNHWAAFWGQLEGLAKWHNWERDDAKQGKEAAAIWADVVQAARDDWMIGECRLQVRQSTTDRCVLERSYDGGDTWTPWAVLSDCTFGRDDGAPFDPGPDAQADSAANLANWMDAILCMIVAAIDDGDTDAEIITETGAFIAAYAPGAATALAIQQWIDGLRLLTPAQRADYCGGDVPTDIYDYSICNSHLATDDGGWIDRALDWIDDALSGSEQWLIDGFNTLADQLGIGDQNFVSKAGGAGGGAAFGAPTCTWQHDFNWYTSSEEQGWFAIASGTASAGAKAATGWEASYGPESDYPPDQSVGVSISRDIPYTRITRIEVIYDYTKGTIPPTARAGQIYPSGPWPGAVKTAADMANGAGQSWVATGDDTVNGIHVEFRAAWLVDDGAAYIHRIIINGVGVNPFI